MGPGFSLRRCIQYTYILLCRLQGDIENDLDTSVSLFRKTASPLINKNIYIKWAAYFFNISGLI